MKRALAVLLLVVLAACSLPDDDAPDAGGDVSLGDPGDCEVIDAAVSSEKIELLRTLALAFNDSDDAELDDDTCVFVRPYSKSSGGATRILAEGWTDEEADGPRPEIWSPASSAWAAILNQRLDDGQGLAVSLLHVQGQGCLMPRMVCMMQGLCWPRRRHLNLGLQHLAGLARQGLRQWA